MKHRFITSVLILFLLTPLFAQDWLELPSLPSDRGKTIVSTQYMVQGGIIIRSHTYRYDPTLRVSRWVAYPLNAGLIGQGSRGEGWHPYKSIGEDLQPSLQRGFGHGTGYDRGHQIPSADRLDRDINAETFVFVNAAPQPHAFNETIWTDFEKLVRTWAKRSDTLYVVTGLIPGKETISDNAGKPVNIPTHFYKAVLRRNTDRYGRVHWSMCAACLPSWETTENNDKWEKKTSKIRFYSLSVERLEEITGETFFPNLAAVIGKKEYLDLKRSAPKDTAWWWK